MPELLKEPLGFLTRTAREFGSIAFLPFGREQLYLLNDPEGIKDVFNETGRLYDKGIFFRRQKDVFGEGLLISEGELWRRQRRLIQPAFHMKRIASLTDAMVQSIETGLAGWEEHAKSGRPLDLAVSMSQITQRIILRTMFSVDAEAEIKVIEAMPTVLEYLLKKVTSPLAFPTWVPTPMNRRFEEAMKTIDGAVFKYIDARRKRPSGENDLLTMLLEARDETGAGMSDRQVRDEVVTIYIAGHETTANSLSWAWYLLSAYPRVERKLAEEVRRVLGDRRPRFEDYEALPYAQMVAQETMRLYPANWALTRTAIQDVEVLGWPVPKGAHVVMSSWVMGRHPEHWDNPERFEPERFEPERSATRHRYAMFPFGGGPRQCIGTNFAQLEQVLILAMIVQRYSLELVPGHPVVPDPLVTLRPKTGLPMYVRTRKETV